MNKILRILILEDRTSDAELIQFELHEAEIAFIVRRAETKKDYVRALHEFSPDLILSDYDLPQYTGALALGEATRLCPDIPFILVTGAIEEGNSLFREIISQGAKECVFKNHLEQLVPAIRRALAVSSKGDATAGGHLDQRPPPDLRGREK